MTRDQIIAYRAAEATGAVAAWLDGKPIQSLTRANATLDWEDFFGTEPNFTGTAVQWRPKPAPEMVKWEWKDVPKVRVILRRKSWVPGIWTSLIAVLEWGIRVSSDNPVAYDVLFSDWEHSTDDGATWKPCGKEKA